MQIDYGQIQKIIESSLDVKVSEAQMNSSLAKISSIKESFIPEVSLYAQTENQALSKINSTPSFGIIANFNLFNGLRDLEQIKVNTAAYEVSKLEFKRSYNLKIFEAKTHYFNVLKNVEKLKLLSEYELINRSNRGLILKKVASGLSPKSEEMIFKKIELELKELKLKVENEKMISISDLKNVLSLNANEKIEVIGKIDITNFEIKLGNKKINTLIAEANEEQLILEKKLSGLWRMPKVNFFVERSFSSYINGEYLEEENKKNIFGVHVSIPLLGEKNEASIADQVQKIELISAQFRKKQQLIESESNDLKLTESINYLKSMIEISKDKVTLSKEIMDRTSSEFRLGLKEAESLNDSSKDYLEARNDLIEHLFDYIIKVEEANVEYG